MLYFDIEYNSFFTLYSCDFRSYLLERSLNIVYLLKNQVDYKPPLSI